MCLSKVAKPERLPMLKVYNYRDAKGFPPARLFVSGSSSSNYHVTWLTVPFLIS